LKLICDEIFGSNNFIAQFTWKRRASSAMSQKNISIYHDKKLYRTGYVSNIKELIDLS